MVETVSGTAGSTGDKKSRSGMNLEGNAVQPQEKGGVMEELRWQYDDQARTRKYWEFGVCCSYCLKSHRREYIEIVANEDSYPVTITICGDCIDGLVETRRRDE